jgi:hypothetical protein
MNYQLIVEVEDVGMLAIPFGVDTAEPALYDRLWTGRGLSLNRYTGQVEYLTQPTGFGEGSFGQGIFGWS